MLDKLCLDIKVHKEMDMVMVEQQRISLGMQDCIPEYTYITGVKWDEKGVDDAKAWMMP